MGTYRVLIADDHPLFREGVKRILGAKPDLEVVGEAGDGQELLNCLKQSAVDLILLDINMPLLTGLDALKLIKKDYPRVKILVLTMHNSKKDVFMAFSSGADGYLLKDSAYEDLFTAIDSIRHGNPYIASLVSNQVIDMFRPKSRAIFPEVKLSPRERQVLELVAGGKNSKQVAELLGIGVASIQTYRYKMKKKLGITNNVDLIKYAFQKGYASVEY